MDRHPKETHRGPNGRPKLVNLFIFCYSYSIVRQQIWKQSWKKSELLVSEISKIYPSLFAQNGDIKYALALHALQSAPVTQQTKNTWWTEVSASAFQGTQRTRRQNKLNLALQLIN